LNVVGIILPIVDVESVIVGIKFINGERRTHWIKNYVIYHIVGSSEVIVYEGKLHSVLIVIAQF